MPHNLAFYQILFFFYKISDIILVDYAGKKLLNQRKFLLHSILQFTLLTTLTRLKVVHKI